MKPLARVLILDMLAPVKREEFAHLIDESAEFDHLSTRMQLDPGSFGPPFDWTGIARVVQQMAADAKAKRAVEAGTITPLYFAGRAPLPFFVLLGQMWNLSGQTGSSTSLTVLNPQRGGAWERYDLGKRSDEKASDENSNDKKPTEFFDLIEVDNEESLRRVYKTTARVAIFISTIGAPAPLESIQQWFADRGEALAATVVIRTSKPGDVSGKNIGTIVTELRRHLPYVSQHFPNTNKFALIFAGPAQLAFAVGGALNPNQYPDVWLGHLAEKKYEYAFSLPLRCTDRVTIPDSAEDREVRRRILDTLIEGIDDLRTSLKAEDFPAWAGDEVRTRNWIHYLKNLTVSRAPEGDAFSLRILTRRLCFGNGLLEALRKTKNLYHKKFGQLFLLHEVYHDNQGLRGTNHGDVGRAGVVLEQTDFIADAFALAIMIRWDLRTGGREAQREPGKLAANWVECALMGMRAFDRLEQGNGPMERLYERRLRRYLTWHLQKARAATIQGESMEEVTSQVDQLFEKRLVVELAPLQGELDANFDKLVTKPRKNTQFFAALDRHLIREAKQAENFDPGSLVEAVRSYEYSTIANAMEFVVEEHRDVLVPWAMKNV